MRSNKNLQAIASVYAKGLLKNVDASAAFADCGLTDLELQAIQECLTGVGDSITAKEVKLTTKEIVETYGK